MFRATAIVIGTLMELPNDRARERVLRWVTDKLAEELAEKKAEPPEERK